ncbi:hypothetical protein ACEWY4_004215 [Coilia grayii]|uniref:Fibrinogen C-terminal domain-containing protein n=1 Tax=Coilia grayii TaxID=363190 RepID=A0ABD1KKV2_9TELE
MSFPDGSVHPRREPHQPRRLDDFLVTQPQRRLPQDQTHTHTGHSDVGDSRPRDATRAPPAAQMSVDASAAILSALRELTEDNRRIKEDNLQLRRDMQLMYQAITARPSASLQVPVVTPGPTSEQNRRLSNTVSVVRMVVSIVLILLLAVGAHCGKTTNCVEGEADCDELLKNGVTDSGVYTIYPFRTSVDAYCDMETDSGGWTVIQKRIDGTVNFYRPWDQYRDGFGDKKGEYWLGLQNLFLLTAQKKYELRVDMEDFNGKKVFAKYSSFFVGSEGDGYRLSVSGFSDGGAGDSLTYHNGQKFSTLDKDQDPNSAHCARARLGAFWYNGCHYANPNGVYRWGADATISYVGVEWYSYTGYNYSLKSMTMMIRPVP